MKIPFLRTLRSIQSFLGSLNYYSRLVEDFAIYVSLLYELREADYHEIGCVNEAANDMSGVGRDDIRERCKK